MSSGDKTILHSLVKSLGRVIEDVVRSSHRHHCANAAAAMAFDFVFAVFPGILVISTLVAILEIPENALGKLMVDLGVVVPLPVVAIVEENLRHLARSSDRLFFLGVIGIVWPASASMSTTMSALNRAYGVVEGRSFWLRRGLSLVLVVSLGMSLVVLFNFSAFGGQVETWLRTNWALSNSLPSLVGLSHRAGAMVGTLLVVTIIYRVAPDARLGWLEVLPGSILFLILWSFIAAGFGYYVSNFGYYNLVTGLLGGVIILLLSAYFVAFTLLLGGELNGSLQRMRRRQ